MRGKAIHRQKFILLLILLLAFALRLYHLDTQSFWSDEGLTLRYATLSPAEALQALTASGFQSPLYFLSLHYWLALGGDSDFAVRFLSALFSTLAVPLLYCLGRALFDSRVGLWAALVMAVNPFQVKYAQEARMYALALCLSLGSVLLFVTALRSQTQSTRPLRCLALWKCQAPMILWAAYALVTALCIYTHYYAFLVPLFEGVFFVVSWRRCRNLTTCWLASQAMIFLLYLPWLPNALRLTSAAGWQKPTDPFSLPWRLLKSYSLSYTVPSPWSALLALGFLLLFILGLYALHTHSSRPGSALFSLLYLLVPLVVVWGVVFGGRGFLEKYLMVVTPAYYLMLGLGLAFLKKGRWPLALVGLCFVGTANACALHNYYFDSRYHNPDYRATANHIEIYEQPGDAILCDGLDPWVVFWHYYQGELPAYKAPRPVDQTGQAVNDLLSGIVARHDRLWLALYFHPPGQVEHWLDTHGFQVYREDFNGVNLYLYSTPEVADTKVRQPATMQAEKEIELVGYRLFPQPVVSGEIAHLTLIWQTQRAVAGNYKVSVRLTDEQGHLYAVTDRQPVDGFYPTSSWRRGAEIEDHYGLLIPPGARPGQYPVEVIMYDPGTGVEQVRATLEPLTVSAAQSWPPPEAARIAHLLEKPFRFGSWVELLGYDLSATEARAGEPLSVVLLWRAMQLVEGCRVRLWLADKKGKVWGEVVKTQDRAWQEGEMVRIPHDLVSDPAAPGGQYELWAEVSGAGGETPGRLLLTTTRLTSRERRFKAPSDIQHPMRAALGQNVTLLGYDLEREGLRAGEKLRLTLYWQATGRMEASYTVFTHLLDEDERLVAQKDSPPQCGAAPTNSWLEGEIVVDEYQIEVGADTRPGKYRLEVGMYQATSGQRLPAFSEEGERLPGDRILLDQVIAIRD